MSNNQSKDNIQDLEVENQHLRKQLQSLIDMNSGFVNSQSVDSDEVNLKELWLAIWNGKLLITAITSVFILVSLIIVLYLPNEYRSTAILAPASQSSSGSLANLAGQFGGLASLAGINLDGASTQDKSVIAIEIIKTWGFLEKFIEDNNIQPEVFAAKKWNRISNTIEYDDSLYDPVNKKWVRSFNPDKGETAAPSSWELYEELEKRISVVQDKKNGLTSISVEFYSPILAKQWTESLVKAINKHIKLQDKQEAQRSIEFLEKQISETTVAEMRTVFYQLIEEQTKTLMLTEVSDEYVFKTISAPKVAEEKSSPQRALILILVTIFGVILSLMIVVIRALSAENKE